MAFTRAGAFEYLSRAHENGRLAHAYLISGPPGSGKHGLASDLSNLVTGGKASDVFASPPPGVYLAEPESKSRRIVIDQVRALEHALQMRSAGGRRKVAIVAEADRLQPQAANAFLKTLEEPPNDSLLLLLSSMPEVLPDTILSRCIAVPLAAEEKAALSRGREGIGRTARHRRGSGREGSSTCLSACARLSSFAGANARDDPGRKRGRFEAR